MLRAAMPLPKRLARFNRHVTNPAIGLVAGRLPWFGIVLHVGRRSGLVRRSPVNLFRADGRWVIALTYGADAQWVRNVLAAGRCEVRTRGRRVRLAEPEVVRDPEQRLVPAPVRPFLRALRVTEFMLLRDEPTAPGG
jgi:deazaflavin-dependent oxidoreductase (nitroreductase family)